MRIGYIYDFQAYPVRGGNHVHAYELTQGFVAKGHTVSVVDDPTMPNVVSFSSADNELEDFLRSIDVLYVRIDARDTRKSPTIPACMKQRGDIPVVWEVNAPANENLAFSWLGGRSPDDWLKDSESIWRRTRRQIHALRQAQRIRAEEQYRRNLAKDVYAAICVSSPLQKYVTQGLGIRKSIVLPNGGPLISEDEIQRRESTRTEPRFTVFYSGSPRYPWQGLDFLTRTIDLAAREAPEILFVLAVNQRKGKVPTGENVKILDALDRDGILDAICSADACVALHPEYHWSKWGFHGSPMKLFEYMACMRPCVTSGHNQMRDLLTHGENALLCENEAEDILAKLLILRADPQAAAAMGRAAWTIVQQQFNWPENVNRTVDLFEQALAQRQPAAERLASANG